MLTVTANEVADAVAACSADERARMDASRVRRIGTLPTGEMIICAEHPTRVHDVFVAGLDLHKRRCVALRFLPDGWVRWVVTVPNPLIDAGDVVWVDATEADYVAAHL